MRMRSIHRQDGAAAVEFAILTPLIFGIMFGMLTLGMAWNTKQTLTYAAREGARFGATYPLQTPTSDWLDDVIRHTEDASDLDFSTTDGASICVAYISDSIEERKFTGETPTLPEGTPANWCYADGLGDEARVQVRVARTAQIVVVIPPDPVYDAAMVSHSSARHEPTALTP